ASAAVIVKVRVVTQPLALSLCVTVTVGALHASVAVTSAFTLASVGKLAAAGLQPKLLPRSDALRVGALGSVCQVSTALGALAWLAQASAAVIVKVRVVTQPLALSLCVTVTVGALHASVAVTSAFTLASVGKLAAAGLQPKLLP